MHLPVSFHNPRAGVPSRVVFVFVFVFVGVERTIVFSSFPFYPVLQSVRLRAFVFFLSSSLKDESIRSLVFKFSSLVRRDVCTFNVLCFECLFVEKCFVRSAHSSLAWAKPKYIR